MRARAFHLVSFLSFILICSFILGGCNPNSIKEPADFIVLVKSAGSAPLEDIEIKIYDGKDTSKLIWAAETDRDGTTTFTGVAGATYIAILKNVPTGYIFDEEYSISSENSEIILETKLLPESELKNISAKPESVFCDFSFSDVKGNTYTLSELLETKKAVVLNFWYLNCAPCKMEFPYLQNAYDKYSDDIEVIAINPLDGTNSSISAFAENNNLTFPMGCGNADWAEALGLSSYPTTLVIDRYGTVAMKHTGAICEEGQFEKIFEFFTSDDYTQTYIRNLSDIK